MKHTASALDSFSTRQVNVLLETLKEHARLLEASHEDARRQQDTGRKPCYVVDYELLRRYMLEEHTHPERVVELEYLFGLEDVAFVLGVGTMVELISDVERRTKIDLTGLEYNESTPLDPYARKLEAAIEDLLGLDAVAVNRDAYGLERLYSLLQQTNFIPTSSVTGIKLDSDVLQRSQDILDAVRPGQSRNNLADAFNITQTMALRSSDAPFFAFLLTSTRHLLHNFDSSSSSGALLGRLDDAKLQRSEPIARSPMHAIYASIVSEMYAGPAETADATNELALRAAQLQAELRRTNGYHNKVPDRPDTGWQDLARSKVGPGNLSSLKRLSSFVVDPVIAETQRIFDNIQQASANLETQRRRLAETYPARRVFDLVSGLSRALEAQRAGAEMFEDTWQYAVVVDEISRDDYTYFCIRDTGDPRVASRYIEVEAHRYYVIFRWATDAGMERILSVFGSAFARHNIDTVLLLVGGQMRVDPLEFDAILPVTSAEILAECDSLTWLRMDSEPFDLYADLVSKPDVDSVVGVIVRAPNVRHVAELFNTTSARFIFSAWLMPALREVAQRAALVVDEQYTR